MMSEWFTSVHIGQVQLDIGDGNASQGVTKRHTGMGECPGVDQNEVDLFVTGFMNAVDQYAFVIALSAGEAVAKVGSGARQRLFNIVKGGMPVYLGLPGAQQIEVGAIEQQKLRHE